MSSYVSLYNETNGDFSSIIIDNAIINTAQINTATVNNAAITTETVGTSTINTLTIGNNIFIPDGSLENPGLAFETDHTTGIYRSGDFWNPEVTFVLNGYPVLGLDLTGAITAKIPVICFGDTTFAFYRQDNSLYIFLNYSDEFIWSAGVFQSAHNFGSLGVPTTPWNYIYVNNVVSSSINNSGTTTLTGAVSCGALTSTGNFSNGTNALTTGAITSSGAFSNGSNALTTGAITSSGAFSNGTNTLTTGAITSSGNFSNGTRTMITGAITSSGIFSNGTNTTTSGSFSAGNGSLGTPSFGFSSLSNTGIYCDNPTNGNITLASNGLLILTIDKNKNVYPRNTGSSIGISTVPFTNGYITNLLSTSSTLGSVTCTSLTSSGTVSCGTNSLTCGSITSSGNFNNGTNSMTTGAITSSGTISCGTNSLTCGAITSSGNFNNGTNSMTTGSLSCTNYVSTAQSFVRWQLTSDVSIPTVAVTSLTWPSTAAFTQGNAITLNPDLFTFKLAITGVYLITYEIVWEATGVGVRGAIVDFNDGYYRGVDVRSSSVTNINQGSVMMDRTANSTFVLQVQQSDVSNLKVKTSVGSVITYLCVRFLG